MGEHGSAYGRFLKALSTRNPLLVTAAAHELPQLSLADALAVCLVLLEGDPKRFGRAAVRWHGRFCLEVRGLSQPEAQLALSALAAMRGPAAPLALGALADICQLHGLTDCARLLSDAAGRL